MFNILDTLHRPDLGSVADVLPWKRIVDDGIIQTKRGGFLSSFVIVGPDSAATSPEEQDYLCEQVTELLNRRSETRQWTVFCNLFRVPSTSYPENGAFASRINRVIDHARRLTYKEEGAHYESRAVLTLHYAPERTSTKRLEGWVMEGAREQLSDDELALKTFRGGIDDTVKFLGNYLSLTPLKQRTMRDEAGRDYIVDDQLSFFYYCLTGRNVTLRPPADGLFLSDYLSVLAATCDNAPIIGDDHVRVIRINGFPEYTLPALFRRLDSYPIPFRVSMRAVLLDREQAIAEIKQYERNHGMKVVPILSQLGSHFGMGAAQISRKALALEQDAVNAREAVDRGGKRFVFFTFNVVLRGPSEALLNDYASQLIAYLGELHFPAAMEVQNASRAFWGTMPGDIFSNLHRPPISTRNLAHMMPLTGIWPGVEVEPSKYYPKNSPPLFFGKTTGTAPFRYSIHAQDTNGHTALIGPSGAGKSTFLGLTISQFERYPGAQGVIIDSGRSLMTLAKAMEADGVAKHYELLPRDSGQPPVGFNPFCYIREGSNEVEYAVAFVETLLRLRNVMPTVELRGAIREGVEALAKQPRISLTHLMPLINDQDARNVIRDYLKSAVGPLIGAESDPDDSAPFVFYETEELNALKDPALTTPVYMHIAHLLERRTASGRPTGFWCDEAWQDFEDPFRRRVFTNLFNLSRKRNLFVIFSVPSLNNIENDKSLLVTVLQQCLTKVFLPNFQATTDEFAPLYKRAGLTNHEIHTIARTLKRARDYYYMSPVGRRPFQLELSRLALAFIGVDGADEIATVRRFVAEDPRNWVAAYLRHIGLERWAEVYEQCPVGQFTPAGEALVA
jgi:type IV secretion system protein VirB4